MSQKQNFSDEDLMVLYQDGDFQAFQQLYERHSPRVHAYLRRKTDAQTATELLQEAFLRVHRARGQYSVQYPFLPWLFTIARSVFLDHLKRAETKLTLASQDSPFELTAPSVAPASEFDLSLALTELPENQRRSIELRYMNDWTFEQIAAELKTSPANARQLISRGVQRLRRSFGGGDR